MAISADLQRELDAARASNAALDAMTDEEWNAHARGERDQREQARTIETLATLGIGCDVWAKPVTKMDSELSDVPLRGGLCVAVTEDRDADTGFVRRAFQTAQWHHGRQLRFEIIGEADVDAWRCTPPNQAGVRAFVRKCCAVIAASNGVFTTDVVECFEVAARLIRAVILPGGGS
jgi:hypothetical protein